MAVIAIPSPRAGRSTEHAVAEWTIVFLGLTAVTCLMTWPLVTDPAGLGRLRLNDARWSIWVVSWVAHALTTNPLQLFDANIFFPHTRTLLLSEPNLVAGAIAAPVWALSRNPLLSHNAAFLASFVLSGAAMYGLAKYLVGTRLAAAVAALMFAFSPYAFAHTAHIQLEMTAGLPLALLAIHRHADRPSIVRGASIGFAIALQALACGYYGVLTALVASFGVVFFGVSRGLWRERTYLLGAIAGAVVAAAILAPLFVVYLQAREATGFTRSLEGSRVYSATWHSYVASAAWAHRWWLPKLVGWSDALFPGLCAVALAPLGSWLGLSRRPGRDVAIFYLALMALAFWISLGPAGGLYTALYQTLIVFSFLRAPSRFGVAVLAGFAILSAFAMASLGERFRGKTRAALRLVPLLVVADLITVPLPLDPMFPVSNSYRMLARLPRGPVAQFPFYWRNADLQHHALYMLLSTYHWQPLINGYSDIFPRDYAAVSRSLASFPSGDAQGMLRQSGVKYVVVDYPRYPPERQASITAFMREHGERFRELQKDRGVVLYEVVSR